MRTRSLLLALSTVTLALFLIPSAVRQAGAKVLGPPDIAWKDMSFKQKRAFMKEVVAPTMKPVLQGFDAKKFKTVNCETCHGKEAADRKYKMPSPDIHALPNTPESF